ncbi:MAG: hypothetical protein KTR15_00020 [Phycisphaeraceae bacterium]|nr:hypothetical protein [Phycisphaeraceae bacterium]
MTKPLSDKQIDQLIADYLAGSLSAADRPAFEAWLRSSPEHPRRVARLSMTGFCIREVCHDTKADYLLDALNQIDEASGPAQLVTLHNLNPSPWQRYRIHAVWGGTIAAALLLGMVLTAVLLPSSNAPNPQEIVENTPNKPAASTPPTPRGFTPIAIPVATLTATHQATWGGPASAAPAQGDTLTSNQRLTLTAGFAEITTNRGAIAILQAPATIELLNNGNALRLHAGKLVGKCDSDSSKGFTVHAPGIDVVDLGTVFGVAAGADVMTSVLVLDGSVTVHPESPAHIATEPVVLMKNHAVSIQPGTSVLQKLEVVQSHRGQRAGVELQNTIAREEFEALSDAVSSRQARWVSYQYGLTQDPALVVSSRRDPPQSSDARSGQGRWPSTSAYLLRGGSDHLVYESIEQTRSMTLSVWVRINALPEKQETLSALVVSDQWKVDRGAIAWQIVEKGNAIKFSLSPGNSDPSRLAAGDLVQDVADGLGLEQYQGEWIHLAVVYNEENSLVTHFLNGQPLQRQKMAFDSPLRPDRIQLGNWHGYASDPRGFNGSMDDFLMLRRAMTDEQMRELYRIGSANKAGASNTDSGN